ncbi:MAG: SPFH domain-containing protein [Muribaculaceae bacterium]|nr:SPFH domain-containing protein [Muribaculaceae bacterium]MDE6809899.1 SPFH domain-containing protein [Muribaculaceae bacterium]
MNNKNKEKEYSGLILNGFIAWMIIIALAIIIAYLGIKMVADESGACAGAIFVLAIVLIFMLSGFIIQEPNQSTVLIFFGKYAGTCRRVGYLWINPLMSRRHLSLRIRNMDVEPIKVNDKIGNPVLIGMVLVWRIKDTYRAIFDVDSQSLASGGRNISDRALEMFVRIQSDAALREVTGHYAYDDDGTSSTELTLRDGGDEINNLLEQKINERLSMAGMEVVEARLNYLAYAPEIAAVMLRRQQASAIISAREKIVEGAVSMVKMALTRLESENVVKFDEERKSRLAGNLLVVLCADEGATPVVSADTD